jgi:hypothetical protein
MCGLAMFDFVLEGIKMGVITKDKGISESMAWAITIEKTR